MNNIEDMAEKSNEKLDGIIELKSMNTVNEEHKDQYKENLLISEDIKNLDLYLTPRSNLELFKKYFPIVIILFFIIFIFGTMFWRI